jgi:hypothetical protein
MRKFDIHHAFAELCRATSQWGLYFEFVDANAPIRAVPFLTIDDDNDTQIFVDGKGIVLCDSKEEADRLFESIDAAKCYALTCSPGGVLLNENT